MFTVVFPTWITRQSIDGCLKVFFSGKYYMSTFFELKQFENLYVCMHHGPV